MIIAIDFETYLNHKNDDLNYINKIIINKSKLLKLRYNFLLPYNIDYVYINTYFKLNNENYATWCSNYFSNLCSNIFLEENEKVIFCIDNYDIINNIIITNNNFKCINYEELTNEYYCKS